MFKYLKHSDVCVRLSVNPFHWIWLPNIAYDKPTPFYPGRRTVAIVWLFLQIIIDLHDGVTDMKAFQQAFANHMDEVEVDEDDLTESMGPALSKPRPPNRVMVKRP